MRDSPTLKVLSLNLAHGRKDAWHQILLSRDTIQANLDEVARVLQEERPDVVALQEADAPSLWSGQFHHVAYLAQRAGIPHFVHGEHVARLKLAYGTALVSRHCVHDPLSHRFTPSRPTPSKGVVACAIQWPGRPGFWVDVVSVHLDFSRKSVRTRQARELIDRLADRRHPRVLMGDFNCGFGPKDTTLRLLTEELDLRAHEPEAEHLMSFPTLRKRLDWILVSPEFDFVEYRTLPHVLSDHRAVVATLRLNSPA